MKVVTYLQEKGGVGKTTCATTAAAGLAIKGYRVLLIDTDPQGHATVSLQNKKMDGLLRLLAPGHDADWAEVTSVVKPDIYAGDYKVEGALYLMPSHTNNRALPMLLDHDFMKLRERLTEIEDTVDIVVFDTSPTPSVTHGMVYMATDYIIFPSECEYLSMDGLRESTSHMAAGNKSRNAAGIENIRVLGVQPTKFETVTNNHTKNLAQMKQYFGKERVWSPIHKRTVWRDAAQAGLTIYSYARGHEAEAEAWGMVENMMKGIS